MQVDLDELAVTRPWWIALFGIAPIIAAIAAALTYA